MADVCWGASVDTLDESIAGRFMPPISTSILPTPPPSPEGISINSTPFPPPPLSSTRPSSIKEPEEDKVHLLIIGSIAVDYTCAHISDKLSQHPKTFTSNPSSITESVGGVAHNVFTAAQLYLNGHSANAPPTPFPEPKVRLITTVASDLTGQSLLSALKTRGIDTSGILVRDTASGFSTARYIALNDANGGLFTAAADMRIVEHMGSEHLGKEIERARPEWLCIDGNLSVEGISEVLRAAQRVGSRVAFEPTSLQKATRLFGPRAGGLGIFPNHSLHLATPNEYELKAMWEHAKHAEYLESMEWFEIIDSINIQTMFRNSIEHLCLTQKLPHLLEAGVIQQAINLLPYIPTLLIKLGAKGVLCLHLLPPNSLQPPPSPTTVTTIGLPGTATRGLYIRYFPPAENVPVEEIVSVNGVGDTFLGVLLGRMSELLGTGQKKLELGGVGVLEDLVGLGQRAAVETLRSAEAVGEGVGRLRVR